MPLGQCNKLTVVLNWLDIFSLTLIPSVIRQFQFTLFLLGDTWFNVNVIIIMFYAMGSNISRVFANRINSHITIDVLKRQSTWIWLRISVLQRIDELISRKTKALWIMQQVIHEWDILMKYKTVVCSCFVFYLWDTKHWIATFAWRS